MGVSLRDQYLEEKYQIKVAKTKSAFDNERYSSVGSNPVSSPTSNKLPYEIVNNKWKQ